MVARLIHMVVGGLVSLGAATLMIFEQTRIVGQVLRWATLNNISLIPTRISRAQTFHDFRFLVEVELHQSSMTNLSPFQC